MGVGQGMIRPAAYLPFPMRTRSPGSEHAHNGRPHTDQRAHAMADITVDHSTHMEWQTPQCTSARTQRQTLNINQRDMWDGCALRPSPKHFAIR
eukprot:700811-Pelagomonas_calceolata.AAC.2